MAQDLRSQIAELERSLPTLPPEPAKLLERATQELSELGIADRVLTEGAQAPDFTLPNAVGRPVTLSVVLGKGPAVVTFYRGMW